MCAKLSDEDAKLSLDLRDLVELDLLNFLIILLIVTKSNHNIVINQFKQFPKQWSPQLDQHGTYAPSTLKHHYLGSPSR